MKVDPRNAPSDAFLRFLKLYLLVDVQCINLGLPIDNYCDVIFSFDDGWTWLDVEYIDGFPQLAEIPDTPTRVIPSRRGGSKWPNISGLSQ